MNKKDRNIKRPEIIAISRWENEGGNVVPPTKIDTDKEQSTEQTPRLSEHHSR